LSRYVGGLIEAAWLVAAASIPLFFNLYSSNIFEPDKTALLRTLAWLSLAAWLVKLIDQGAFLRERNMPGRLDARSIIRIPLALPVAALAGVYLISTIFSITPRLSLFGSYQRLQGTYTTISYLVIFASVAGNLRRRAQVERLITAMILSSLPVSLYGVLQHYHMDPIQWGGYVSLRVAANLGNPVFLGAYLIMVFPLTAYRVLESFDSILADRGPLGANFLRSSVYIFVGALQLLALFFTGSRGPWLGWIAGQFFTLVILSILWRKRWIAFMSLTLVVLGAGFLWTLSIPDGPLESLQPMPTVARLGELLDAESPTARVRILIWKGVVGLVMPHQPVQYPDGGQDAFNPIRPLVGYGPESMYEVYMPYYPLELAQAENSDSWPDSAHNAVWDALVRSGLLGLVSYLALIGSLLYYGLKWLGLIAGARQSQLFWGLFLGGGTAGAAGFVLVMGPGFFGIGMSFGLLIGVLAYLTLTGLSGDFGSPQTGEERPRAMLLTALLAAVIGHFVETNFGFAVTVTQIYFWIMAGLLLVTGYLLPAAVESKQGATPAEDTQDIRFLLDPEEKPQGNRNGNHRSTGSSLIQEETGTPWQREALISGFISALILVPLGYDFLTISGGSRASVSLLWSSLVRSPDPSHGSASYGILGIVLMTVFLGGFLLASESVIVKRGSSWGQIFAAILGISILLGLIFWLFHSLELVKIARSPAGDLPGALVIVNRIENLLTAYSLYSLALTFILSFFLADEWPVKTINSTWTAAIAIPAALILLSFGWITNLRLIQADMASNQAGSYLDQGSYPTAIAIYKQAVDLAPRQDAYKLSLAKAYLEYAKQEKDHQTQDQLVVQARGVLVQTRRLDPLDPEHTANLARLYRQWASFASDPGTQFARGEISSRYYSQAIALSPNSAELWDEWGELYLNLFKQPDTALAKFSKALEIDPAYDGTHALMGEYYLQEAQSFEDPGRQRDLLNQAAEQYRQALEKVRYLDIQNRYRYSKALSDIYAQLGQPQSAISVYQRLVRLFPAYSDRWQVEEAMGKLYLQLGDQALAISHYENALATAPDDQKERLRTLLAQLMAGG
jgi:tetratricopeptide (TPR) repeat protein